MIGNLAAEIDNINERVGSFSDQELFSKQPQSYLCEGL